VNAEPGRWQPVQSRGFATQQSPGQPPASPYQSMLKATPRERRAALFSGLLGYPFPVRTNNKGGAKLHFWPAFLPGTRPFLPRARTDPFKF